MTNYFEALKKENEITGSQIPDEILSAIVETLEKSPSYKNGLLPLDIRIVTSRQDEQHFIAAEKIKKLRINGWEISITNMVVRAYRRGLGEDNFIQVYLKTIPGMRTSKVSAEHRNGRRFPARNFK